MNPSTTPSTDASLNLPQHFLLSQDFLSDLMPIFPYPASLKDLKSGKYILVNEATVKHSGLRTADEFIDLTVRDVINVSQSCWDVAFANRVEKLDYELKTQKKRLDDKNYSLLTTEGLVRLQDFFKIPVINHDNRVVAVFTFSQERTQNLKWEQLLQLYQQFYDRKQAIRYFLKFLRIDHYFNENLTETELFTLMTMKKLHSQKQVANTLGVHLKTVEAHIGHIRNKLHDASLSTVLEGLRNGSSYRTD